MGGLYFTVSFLDRIKKGSGTYNFQGTATNPGNKSFSLNGVDSSVISIDLRNDTSIPAGAVVSSIDTSSRQTPSQGNVLHKIMSYETNDWYTATVTSATSGSYSISLQDELDVARKWNFKYNAKASGASTMNNVCARINYEYNVTDQF